MRGGRRARRLGARLGGLSAGLRRPVPKRSILPDWCALAIFAGVIPGLALRVVVAIVVIALAAFAALADRAP